jgi:hypothetical protein
MPLYLANNFVARCAMFSTEETPPHALFVQWGKFKAGAFGIPAIIVLGLLALAVAAVLLWR